MTLRKNLEDEIIGRISEAVGDAVESLNLSMDDVIAALGRIGKDENERQRGHRWLCRGIGVTDHICRRNSKDLVIPHEVVVSIGLVPLSQASEVDRLRQKLIAAGLDPDTGEPANKTKAKTK